MRIFREVELEQTTFTDSDGVLWAVREDGADDARALSSDAAPGSAWLRFESDLEVRRLWHYPDDWRGLSPLQLESLLDRASTVIARFRPAHHRAAAVPALDREVGVPADLRPRKARHDDICEEPPSSENTS
jgi:hypothetical protein